MEKRFDKPFQKREDKYTPREKENDDIIFGVRAVIEAINSGREINKLMIQKGMQKELFFELKEATANKNYFIQFVPIERLDRITTGNRPLQLLL